MRTRLRQLVVSAVALFTASAVLPSATAADERAGGHHPSHGGLSAVIRYTEYGVPHIVAKDYANLGFGTGWAQAADQVCARRRLRDREGGALPPLRARRRPRLLTLLRLQEPHQ